MIPKRIVILPAAVMSAFLSVIAAENSRLFSAEPEAMEAGVAQLLDRMLALTPSEPMGYFELAEELAYLSVISPHQQQTALRMAGQLYVLAYELDRRSNPRPSLGASVCYGLADIVPESERDWYLALAASFKVRPSSQPDPNDSMRTAEDRARLDTAEALGRYRAVERRPLSAILRRVDARQQMINAGVSVADADWAAQLLQDGLEKPYCPECRNLRLTRTGTSDQLIEQQLCTTCFGNPEPDPALSSDELKRMLAIEAKLLGAVPASWSAQIAVNGPVPVQDLDPSALAERFGVDPDRPYWNPEGQTALIGEWSDTPLRTLNGE